MLTVDGGKVEGGRRRGGGRGRKGDREGGKDLEEGWEGELEVNDALII